MYSICNWCGGDLYIPYRNVEVTRGIGPFKGKEMGDFCSEACMREWLREKDVYISVVS